MRPSDPEADDKIRRSYPGGPSKSGADAEPDAARKRPHLRRAEEIEARAQDRRRTRVAERRRRRIIIGFVVALVVAGGAGFWLGLQSHRTAAEIAAEEEAAREERGFDLGAESDRIMRELWLMEDLERARQP